MIRSIQEMNSILSIFMAVCFALVKQSCYVQNFFIANASQCKMLFCENFNGYTNYTIMLICWDR